MSGGFRNHFAGEKWCLRDFADTQEGCEIISQHQAKLAGLRSWLPPWGSQLPACGIYRATSGGNTPHCTKRLWNHFATKGWFRNTLQNASFSSERLACNGCNFFVSTLNCTLFEALDCWLPELWNGYSMHQLDFRKCSKSGCHHCHQEYASWQISLFFLSLHSGFTLGKWLPSFAQDPQSSPQTWIALVIKILTKTPKLTQSD